MGKKDVKKLNTDKFYMNKKTGHPSKPIQQKGHMVTSLGFTSDPKQDIVKKTKLNHNIDPNSNEDCYVKNKQEVYEVRVYKTKSKFDTFRIHEDDIPIIEELSIKKGRHEGLPKRKA